MSTIVNVRLDAKTKDATKNVGKFNEKLKDTSKASKNVQADLGEVKNQADAAAGGAISKFRGLIGTIKNVSKSFFTLRGAIFATGLGALVLVIGSIVQAFKSSEEGQNKFAKLMGIIGSVVGNLTDILADFGMGLIDAFTNPIDSIKNFATSIKEFVMDKIEQLMSGLGYLGSAFEKLFDGDFSGAANDLGKGFVEIQRAVNPAVIAAEALANGINKAVVATKDLVKESIKDAKSAAKVADMRAKADKMARQLTIDRANADRERAELLEKAVNKEMFTVQERIGFLKQAGALEEEITNKEIEAAKLRSEAKILENSLSKSTKEDLDEENNLKAEAIRLETAKLTKQKEVTSQTIALLAEEKAAKDAIKAQEKTDKDAKDAADLEAEKSLADIKKQIRDAEAVSEDEQRALEIQKTQEHYDNLILLAEQNGLDTTNLKAARDKKLNELNQGAAEDELEWADITTQQKLDMAGGALNDMATIMGKESAAGKAAAAAAATISTFSSANKAYESMSAIPVIGPALGAVAAGAAVVAGMLNVKKILSTKTPGGGGGSPSLGVTGSGAAKSQPPSFNIVGANSQNQLAETIAGTQNKPVKAFVVSNEVSSAQALDRNIVESASLG